jgi:AMP deaminase
MPRLFLSRNFEGGNRAPGEWDALGRWFVQHQVLSTDPSTGASTDHVRWVIQIPRLWQVFCGKPGCFGTFAEMLENIFAPLFEVTLDPSSHPELHLLLRHVPPPP